MKPYVTKNRIRQYTNTLVALAAVATLSSCSDSNGGDTNIRVQDVGKDNTVIINMTQRYVVDDEDCPDTHYKTVKRTWSSGNANQPDQSTHTPSQQESDPTGQHPQQPRSQQEPRSIDDAVAEQESAQPRPQGDQHQSSSYQSSSGCNGYQAPRKDVSYRTGFKPVGHSSCGGAYQSSLEQRHDTYDN